jgi:hypothetical protein
MASAVHSRSPTMRKSLPTAGAVADPTKVSIAATAAPMRSGQRCFETTIRHKSTATGIHSRKVKR